MGSALRCGSVAPQVSAGNMEDGVHIQFTLILPDIGECDMLGVAQEPGGFVIERGGPLFEGTNSQEHGNGSALGSQPLTGGCCGDVGSAVRVGDRLHTVS
jgi:hypothetical protein